MSKILLTEVDFQTGFAQIKQGDVIVVVTLNSKYNFQVVSNDGSQISMTSGKGKYIMVANSLDDTDLRLIQVLSTKVRKWMHRGDVANILIYRGGNMVNMIPTRLSTAPNAHAPAGKPAKGAKPNPNAGMRPFYQEAYNGIMEEISKMKEDDKLIIKTGELVTNDTIGEQTITYIEIHIRKVFNGMVKGAIVRASGRDAATYDALKHDFILFNPKAFQLTKNGVILNISTHGLAKKPLTLHGVFDVAVSKFSEGDDPGFDDMMQNKNFRDMMYKNPSFFGQLMGQDGKGVIPMQQAIEKLGMASTFHSKGKKVKFSYSGKHVRGGLIELRGGETYYGRFTKETIIKMISQRRGESVYITLKDKVADQQYTVDITFERIRNSKPESTKIGVGLIKIIDLNFA